MTALILQFPFSAKSKAPPRKQKNRDRKYLSEVEVEKVIAAIKKQGRHGHRNATAILIAYRHGLRCTELINLQWSQINFDESTIEVIRAKKGKVATHPLDGRELRALRRLQREYGGAYVFQSERGASLSERQFHHIVATAGQLAKLPVKAHPHQLRHGCGYYLANKNVATRTIQDYLGHKKIEHTVRYTASNSQRFANLWR